MNPMFVLIQSTFGTCRRSCWVACLIIVATLSQPSNPTSGYGGLLADEPQGPQADNYLVVPVQTELQRYYFRDYRDVSAFVFVNAMDPINEDATVLDAAAIDFNEMEKSLTPYAANDPPGKVVFAVRARKSPERLPAAGILSRALGQFAREIGLRDCEVDFRRYSEAGPAGSRYFNNWKGLVADLEQPASELDTEAESGVGDDVVMLFAVRTPLSRHLYGGEYRNAADCVAFIIPPIEDADMSKAFASMQSAVDQLSLNKKHRIMLRYHSKNWRSTEARVAMEELTGERLWRDLLGFDTYTFGLWNQPPMQALEAQRQADASQP